VHISVPKLFNALLCKHITLQIKNKHSVDAPVSSGDISMTNHCECCSCTWWCV